MIGTVIEASAKKPALCITYRLHGTATGANIAKCRRHQRLGRQAVHAPVRHQQTARTGIHESTGKPGKPLAIIRLRRFAGSVAGRQGDQVGIQFDVLDHLLHRQHAVLTLKITHQRQGERRLRRAFGPRPGRFHPIRHLQEITAKKAVGGKQHVLGIF